MFCVPYKGNVYVFVSLIGGMFMFCVPDKGNVYVLCPL